MDQKKEQRRAQKRKYYHKGRDELRQYEVERARAQGLPPPPQHGNCLAMRNRSEEEKRKAKKQTNKVYQAKYRAKNRLKRAAQQRAYYARKKKQLNAAVNDQTAQGNQNSDSDHSNKSTKGTLI